MKAGTLSRYLYNHVHKSIIQHSQKMEATYASIGKCMEKQNVEKEIVHRATAWMNTEDTMLSETSQSQKEEYCMVPLV